MYSLWSLSVPPRIKNFIWRLAREVIPTRAALRRRHIAVPAGCGVCGSNSEDYNHLFFDCPFAIDCWDQEELLTWIGTVKSGAPQSNARLQRLLLDAQTDSRDKACVVIWGIWNERNMRVWKNESCTARTAMKLALDKVSNWRAAQASVVPAAGPTIHPCEKWHAPPFGSLKCNLDVGFNAATNEMGMGIILRDCDGRVVGFKQWHDVGQWTPREGEAAALLSAMYWVAEVGYEDVIFECDAEAVSIALASDEDDLSEFGCFISRCRDMLASFPRFRVQVVRRNRN
ncbi:Putative ribonuclease H protein At1g65750 [Linum perenne]